MYQTKEISYRFVYQDQNAYYNVCIPKKKLDPKDQKVQTAYVLRSGVPNCDTMAQTLLKITLCKDGLMIGSTEDGAYLKVDGQLDHYDCCGSVTIDRKYDESSASLWTLKEAKGDHGIDNAEFYVEMTYGEVRPRLALEKLSKSNQIRLNVITRDLSEKITRENMNFKIIQVRSQ